MVVPVFVVYPAPFVSSSLFVGIVVLLKAFEPSSLVPTALDPLITNAVDSPPCVDRPSIDIPSKKIYCHLI